LGAVEARAEDRPLTLGGPKQRALLALLLLRTGEVVSREALVDALWGAEPPRSAVQSLQVYVHGLRQALGGGRIETVGSGYRLPLDDGELDLVRFERLLDQGGRALAAGRPADAADDLRAALALWRGSALADLGGEPVAEAEAPRLEDRRLAAQELLNDAQLALGRHEALVPELERLIAAEPYRERFRAQHILALYRAGRQTDALAAYRVARDALVEELGVEPSPELQELERRILRHDPSLTAPPPSQPGEVRLPSPPTSLVGRRLEVAAVTGLLAREDVRLVTLTGAGGSGKTRLAIAAAAEFGPTMRDGAVFVDVAPIRDPEMLAPAIVHALGVSESGTPEEVLQAYLRDRSMLLLLDNLEQLVPQTTLVSRLLSAAPRLIVLATSRTPLRLSGEHEYPVPTLALPERHARATFEELAANDAVQLFVARARAVDPAFELRDDNIEDVRRVCERLDGLPLAIELAAARTRLLAPEEMSRRLDQSLELLTEGPYDVPERQQTLRATLEWSHELLTEDERELFARLSVFRGGWTLAAAEQICSAGPQTLSSLVDENLARRIADERFALLETIREYASELLGEADELHRRHAEYMVRFAEETAEPLSTGGDQSTAIEKLDADLDNLRAAQEWLAAGGEIDLELRLLIALENYLSVRGHLSEGRRLVDSAAERSTEADLRLRAALCAHGATFPTRQGDPARARELLEEGLAHFRELGDGDQEARCIGLLGNVAVAEGDLDLAEEHFSRAAELAREYGNESRLAKNLSNLGSVASFRDDARTALRYQKEAVEIERRLDDRVNVAITLHNISRGHLFLGELGEARSALAESFTMARELGYTQVMAYCIEGLSELAMREGNAEQAAEALGASQHAFAEIGATMDSPQAEAGHAEIMQFASTELGAERAEELRQKGAALSLDSFTAFDR
jgi:predicted ATPase/DNA-binding SARP family transcriptional activator